LRHYGKATQLNSLNAEYQADLAYVYALTYRSLKESGHQFTDQLYQQAVSAMEKAENLKPHDIQIRSSLLSTANRLGDFTLMHQQAEGALLTNLNDINSYEVLVQVLAAGLYYYQQAGDEQQTGLLANELKEVPLKLAEQQAKINPDRPWNGEPLKLTSEAQYSIAQANYLLGNYAESLTIFQTASPDLFKEAANENIPQPVLEEFAWYAASLHKTGATIEAENIAQQLKSLDTQAYSTYEKLIKQEPLQYPARNDNEDY